MDVDEILLTAEEKMGNAVEALGNAFGSVRTGRANARVLDRIKVDYYGNPTPIDQVANVNTPDAHQIVIQPWERNMLPVIEKAILAANIGVTPQNNGEFIRLVIPAPTEERRKELVKKAKQDAEQTKVAIRNIRRTANDDAKKLKDDGVEEDAIKKLETDIQKATDEAISKVDKIMEAKEKEIMTV